MGEQATHAFEPTMSHKHHKHQKRICEYFGLPCRHTKTFLHLPLSVRRQVYVYAGLPVDRDILLTPRDAPRPNKFHYPTPLQRSQYADDDRAFSSVMSMLQTNPQVHDDVLSALCAVNHIIICQYWVEYGLSFLRRLSRQACSEMRHLYIHLYLEERHGGYTSYTSHWQSVQRNRRGLPIEALLYIWQKAASHVLSNAMPGQLKLHLICDTGLTETTHRVSQPLFSHAGVLKECHVRLSPGEEDQNGPISRLARFISLQSMDLFRVEEPMPFRFMELPPELRHKILQYTDLVTPRNEVHWSQRKGFHLSHGPVYRQGDWDAARPEADVVPWDSHPLQFITCYQKHSDVRGFFCRVYGNYSPTCHCWQTPSSLLLVSRALYYEAIAVLYTYNRIILSVAHPDDMNQGSGLYEDRHGDGSRRRPGNGDPNHPWQTTARLPASRFLTGHMYPVVLSHIRHLELIFPDFLFGDTVNGHVPCFSSTSPSLLDWAFALDHLHNQRLATSRTLSPLTVTVHMDLYSESRHRFFEPLTDQELLQQLLRQRSHFLLPLRKLREDKNGRVGVRGFGQLYVFLDRDWRYWRPPPGLRPGVHAFDDYDEGDDAFEKMYLRWEGWHDGLTSGRREWRRITDGMEESLEKEVMGDNYDISNVGDSPGLGANRGKWPMKKSAYWPSQWTFIVGEAQNEREDF